MAWPKLLLGTLATLMVICFCADASAEDEELSKFIEGVSHRLAELYDEISLAQLQADVSGSTNRSNVILAETRLTDYLYSIAKDVAKYRELGVGNSDLQRELRHIPVTYEVLTKEEYDFITNFDPISTGLTRTVCSYTDSSVCNETFFPHVLPAVTQFEDLQKSKYYFTQWARKSADALLGRYIQFLELYRKAAKLSGFSSVADYWYRELGESSSTVSKTMDKIIEQTQPLFEQTHAYLRGQLLSEYGPEAIEYNKPLGDYMYFGLSLTIDLNTTPDDFLPFKTQGLPNVTASLLNQGYTAKDILDIVHRFHTSLGMPQLENSFWQDSCAPAKDTANILQTHNVYKFYGQNTVNLTYLPVVDETKFSYAIVALTNVYYKRAFANQKILYQKPVSFQMDEDLGWFFATVADSPKYLNSLGITYPDYRKKESRINRLYLRGMSEIFSIRLHYAIEHLRVGFLDESIDINDNCAAWSLIERVRGLQPADNRSKSDFDATIALTLQFDSQVATKVYAVILRYQIFEHFCRLAGEYQKNDPTKPLDLCDLTGHPEVGEQIYKAMSLGAAVDLKQFLRLVVNSEELDASGFLAYYQPLHDWFEEQNKLKNNQVGWESANKCH